MDRLRLSAVSAVVAGLGLAIAPASAVANSTTANLSVTATVTNNCTISTSPVDFGSYDPVVANASTNLDATGGVTIACTKDAVTTIGLGLGGNASGSTRRMGNGTDFMTYELYKDAPRSTVWGNSGIGLFDSGAAPSTAPRTFTVHGRVPAAQDVSAGSYADTVVATVNF